MLLTPPTTLFFYPGLCDVGGKQWYFDMYMIWAHQLQRLRLISFTPLSHHPSINIVTADESRWLDWDVVELADHSCLLWFATMAVFGVLSPNIMMGNGTNRKIVSCRAKIRTSHHFNDKPPVATCDISI